MTEEKTNTSISILLVEDDKNLGFVIKDKLEESGYQVALCEDGKSALSTFYNDNYDLCVLDVMLPKMDGFELADEIKRFNVQVPIIFLTAKSMTEDKIEGFKKGADDYITKPFDFEELRLRIQAILGRIKKSRFDNQRKTNLFKIGNFRFDSHNQLLKFEKEEIKLTKKENKILRLLCLHQDKILKRESTLNSIWGSDDYFSGRSMDVFISKLRKYLQKDPSVQIVNIHGVGFKLIVKK